MELIQNERTCCFFEHREVTHDIPQKLTETIENLIIAEKVDNFYVGNLGQFDIMVNTVLSELKTKYPHIKYTVALAYMPDRKTAEKYGDNTLYRQAMLNFDVLV